MGAWDHLTPGMRAEIAKSVCIPLWNSLRAGRRRQAHGLARAETLARDSMAIATASGKAGTAL